MVIVRRRSVAVALVTGQALLLAAVALGEAGSGADVAAAFALLLRAVGLEALFLFLVSRTRESRPVRASVVPLARAGLASPSRSRSWLVPEIGLDSRDAERAVLALVAFGMVCAATRRPSSRCSASSSSRTRSPSPPSSCGATSSLAIEIGVAVDLTLIALVAAVFHERIFAEFGAGDTAALRRLRD